MKENKASSMAVDIICTAVGTIIGIVAVVKAPNMAAGTKALVRNVSEGIGRVWGKVKVAVTPKEKEDKPAA